MLLKLPLQLTLYNEDNGHLQRLLAYQINRWPLPKVIPDAIVPLLKVSYMHIGKITME